MAKLQFSGSAFGQERTFTANIPSSVHVVGSPQSDQCDQKLLIEAIDKPAFVQLAHQAVVVEVFGGVHQH